MAQIIKHRGFIIEVHKDYGGNETYYVKAKKKDGILLHTFDIEECLFHSTEEAAIEEGRKLINDFLDTKPETINLNTNPFVFL